MSFNSNSPHAQGVNIFVSLINRLRLVLRLLRDPRVPLFTKLIPFTSLIYIIFPLDFIPDIVPGLGQVDDLGAIILAIEAFILMAPQDVVQEHRAAIEREATGASKDDTVIDGQWHTVNRGR